MPLFDFKCSDCNFSKEHFLKTANDIKKTCPKCGSENYSKRIGTFRMEVEYKDNYEHKKYKQDREMQEVYARIGKESLDEDTKTLDNLFGEEKVKQTFYGTDYESRGTASDISEG